MKEFKVKDAPIEVKMLVEASAGTGKTFSIGVMVLRLILEMNIQIDQMLLVTFTNDAVEELQVRIRKFIKEAYQYVLNDKSPETVIIKEIIDEQTTIDKNELANRLKTALYLLDEANIMTIHGFAQRMLSEYAFETHQDFGAEMVTDISDIQEQIINEFWRNEVTGMSQEALEMIGNLQSFKEDLPKFATFVMRGEQYFNDIELDLEVDKINAHCQEQIDNLYEPLLERYEEIIDCIKEKGIKNSGYEKCSEFDFIYKLLKTSSKSANYYQKLVENLEWLAPMLEDANYKRGYYQNPGNFLKAILKSILAKKYIPKIKERLEDARLLTFDDIIQQFHKGIVTNNDQNKSLIQTIRQLYKAVFIDEFQDTDILQFEFFEELFIHPDYKGAVFLIGDPKQSIYAFRGADVDSYLTAKEEIQEENRFSMYQNFRSTEEMIAEVNDFYDQDALGGFAYEDGKITYQRVQHRRNEKLMGLRENTPYLQFFKHQNKYNIAEHIAKYILSILNDKNIKMEGRNVQPSDFAILSRTKSYGRKVQAALARVNIPAVMVFDENVLNTEEMKSMIYLATAMLSPNFKNIKTALFLSFINEDIDQLDALNEEEQLQFIQQFTEYKNMVFDKSFYQAFDRLLQDFNLNAKFSQSTETLRILTNVRQIMELMNEQQFNKGKSPEEILAWLSKAKEEEENKEYTLQIESDEDAVKIATIHSSKGLEYNWVIVLGMESSLSEQNGYSSFKEHNKKYFADKGMLREKIRLFLTQQDQERKRLLYVAITRAKYKCDFFYSNFTIGKSTLNDFNFPAVDAKEYFSSFSNQPYQSSASKTTLLSKDYDPEILDRSASSWRKQSFSSLNQHSHRFEPINKVMQVEESYDQFIFELLGRGSSYGDRLHKMMESIPYDADYSVLELLDENIATELRRFNNQREEIDNTDNIRTLVHHLVNAKIELPHKTFSLSEVNNKDRLIELEFNFQIFGTLQDVQHILEKHGFTYHFKDSANFYGLLNGKIDLFFRHGDEFYILDWKSNYLGNHLDAYNKENLQEAMLASGYQLQYLLYTIAVYKFLKSRKPNFDYDREFGGAIYVFMRGVRANSSHGIFTDKPPKELVEALVEVLGEK